MLTQRRISFTVCILLLWCPANLLGQAQPPSGQGVRNDCMSRSDDAKQDQANRCYDFEPIRQLIRRKVTEDAVPSMAVAVARSGRVLWEQGFGAGGSEVTLSKGVRLAGRIRA
jgi:hypothetical protein